MPKNTDIAAILGKGLVGAIPFVGPLAAEIVGAIIPNQRIDRIESLLKLLESKIAEDEKSKVEEKIVTPESVDLIEDGFLQAARALSEERKDYIASLLKNSLTNDRLEYIENKRLLSILGQLNDLEIIILKSYTLHHGEPDSEEFFKIHQDSLQPPDAFLGSTQEDLDKHVLHQTHKTHLASLGLLRPGFKRTKKGELPEFDDKTGMIKANGYSISPLGRLLLRSIDQINE
ncbi:hypothetical protein EA797_03955 [Stutzerimonas zhaodongensis]|uniref:DUF4393 domain-containing protein n=1 Tax=Stutzerimonas zhaodongensis TaxID=1176257 RepID=A0A3M2HQB0_9GAMM|nr:hypothetical protein [Stutzerimonas zhaodongensis]MCQ4317173.1 hypothetical protein [Stutzerimonas zhaodongensis]RMH91901.1 hypothetical protein EA797_03955 [Stutzerimonas zhaodongensis]